MMNKKPLKLSFDKELSGITLSYVDTDNFLAHKDKFLSIESERLFHKD